MSLVRYREKRDFKATPEPAGHLEKSGEELRFVIQKHDARRLHYDFRLELGGVLKSWAVPKGPSLDPHMKRLAVEVEDHPIDYGDFEGVIPERHYGAGNVIVWDRGTWKPLEDPARGLRKGHLRFTLDGERLSGEWSLVRMPDRERDAKGHAVHNWLLIKAPDDAQRTGDAAEITAYATDSVISGESVNSIAGKVKGKSGKAVRDDVNSTRAPTAARTKEPAPTAKKSAKASPGTKDKPAARSKSTGRTTRTARAPAMLSPQLAKLATRMPSDTQGWIAEIKFDGYRILAHFDAEGEVRLYSRNANDWTDRMPDIAAPLRESGLRDTWLDGEVVAVDASGRPSFQLLQNAFADVGNARGRGRGKVNGPRGEMRYYVFDAPWLNGEDLQALNLIERKERLAATLEKLPATGPVIYSAHLSGRLDEAFGHACRHGLEGIMLKRADGTYHAGGRSPDWLKIKCQRRQEFVIGGYSDPSGTRTGFGALLLGQYDSAGRLHYAGRVGTGFDDATLRSMEKQMRALSVARPAFDNPPTGADARGVHWIKPELVAEIRYAEMTSDGIVRQGAFQGLRSDKPAHEVRREEAVEPDAQETAEAEEVAAPHKRSARASAKEKDTKGRNKAKDAAGADTTTGTSAKVSTARSGKDTDSTAGVRISHASRIVIPDSRVTKLDIARYYESMADWVVPQLAGRLVSLVRCPEGAAHECFFQKHLPAVAHAPDVHYVPVKEKSGRADYIHVDSLTGVVGLVQFGVLEFHAWGSRIDEVDKPDRMIFDLDPGEGVTWQAIREAALLLQHLLDSLGMRCFLKTSGGKGLHVEVPLARTHSWELVKDFSHAIADHVAKVFPDRFVSTSTKAKRPGKIYIDYLRNGRGATAVVGYSTRARAGAPVAMPISWQALDDLKGANAFTIFNALDHVRSRKQDPWADYAKTRGRITREMAQQFGVKAE